MNLSLAPEIQNLIDDRVKSGKYRSAEDAVTAAITYFEQQERLIDLTLSSQKIREKLAAGLGSASAGRLSDGEAFFEEFESEDEQPDRNSRKSA
jgi:antitoxin ParD1/3/4